MAKDRDVNAHLPGRVHDEDAERRAQLDIIYGQADSICHDGNSNIISLALAHVMNVGIEPVALLQKEL
jgi:hypothetical protein